jgi:FHS family L-fucose permease-like MFS transporter
MATTLAAAPSDRTYLGPMIIIGVLFFIFGFFHLAQRAADHVRQAGFQPGRRQRLPGADAFYFSYFFLRCRRPRCSSAPA